jgi:hypothetical protein
LVDSSTLTEKNAYVNSDDAENAASRVFQPIGTKGAAGYNQNIDPIKERYRGLGKKGTASLVQIAVPEDADFDFLTFHQEVDDLLGPAKAEPKIM